ncbi:alpha-N-acetylgalactosamine-specific lectin-like [Branchiostoma floridae x Branchiostoma belcheri]
MRQLSTTVDALKRDLDAERNRTAALEQRLHDIRKTLPSCPVGYTMYRGICYKAFNTLKNFSEAAAACREDGGTLAMPRDAETNAFLVPLYESVRHGWLFWIGLHDQREEGRFEWVDGSALGPYNSWGTGQPDGNWSGEDCVYLKDKWNDYDCNRIINFICQTAPGRP